ncbi:MAG: Glutamyl-tRNA(Gln) amidotransferase subunit D [Berkelbacteria bacterium GW2011_GWA1_36_9]|uniref:Glutamyl-tRNA(Gln) amidotransferase subunit D n=1 Tax=Berkelbacteria bacterium GW2011_GWA1_36_9 TaxID=1618331 RepID=A0A0G0FIK5_9BACT|nr:MAG: Glutamyl-tRNA(Gln) amidotransferase subunit D [Berkelbacteria bacterium GW2011_GWA1_36_9]
MAIKEGDLIEVRLKNESIQGVLMPSKDKKIILKLKSGYNMSIDGKNIISKKLIKQFSEKKQAKIIQNSNLPKILILNTGGTISSSVDYKTGAVSSNFSPEALLSKYPELSELCSIKSKMIFNELSENFNFRNYNTLAEEIEKEIGNFKGFIITHGTDTMAYTSAALSFALENLGKPVILVGSQRSSDRPSSDSFLNLFCAINFILNTEFKDVAICMHSSMNDDVCNILPASKTKKLHSSRRDAFRPVNSEPIAEVSKDKIKFFEDYKKESKDKLKLKLFKENLKIGILTTHPNMHLSEVLLFKDFDGLIINATGLGHVPEKSIEEIKKLKMPKAIVTQAIFGNVNLDVYSTGRMLKPYVLGDKLDLTLETAYIKMAWLLSNHPKQLELFNKNLRNEINERLLPAMFI